MTMKRAAHYTWRAFLTFLLVSIPAIVIQAALIALFANWRASVSDWPESPVLVGGLGALQSLSGLYIQFAILFVIFKYAPDAIAEVQEARQARRDEQQPVDEL